MKHFKIFPHLLFLCIGLIALEAAQAQVTISLEDFEILDNTSWEGNLSYLDYQSGKLVPVASTMQIKITDKVIEQNVQYTWEPDKNVQAKTKIRKNGTYLGEQKVISKTVKADGTIQLITTVEGKDDNKKASLFYTYEFNGQRYKVRKEVQFEGANKRFMRNSYDYKKI